jgi:hypothetical protein
MMRGLPKRWPSFQPNRWIRWHDPFEGAPDLQFTPYAWAKMQYLRDCGPTEIGGFGISAADDLMLVENVVLVPQTCGPVSVVFDDAAIADYFDQQVDQGLVPERFARIWIHTHPGHSASPSTVDEATFRHVFGRSNWAVMFITARGGECQARLQFSAGPTAVQPVGVSVDFGRAFPASDQAAWQSEYQHAVRHCLPAALDDDLLFDEQVAF